MLLSFIWLIIFNIIYSEQTFIKVGLAFPFKDAFWSDYEEKFRNISIEFQRNNTTFEFISRYSEQSISIQQADVEYLLSQKINVLVIVPHDAKASKTIKKYCDLANIKIIAFNRIISDVEIDAYVSPNLIRAGELQAEFIVKNYNNTTTKNLLLMRGPDSDKNSMLFYNGSINYLKNSNLDFNITYLNLTKWDKYEAADFCKSIREKNITISFIIAGNDDIGKSCIEVLNPNNNKTIFMSGHDNASEEVKELFKLMEDNFMTVDMNQDLSVYEALKVAKNIGVNMPINFNNVILNGNYEVPYILVEVKNYTYNDYLENLNSQNNKIKLDL
jgi:D-xylose transport system substrate-binding protein